MSEESSNHVDSTVSFFSNILAPGSSFHPTFLFILDAAFVGLLLILLGLLFATHGNVHILSLIIIELCLWASVKWFIYELKQIAPDEKQQELDSKKST